MRNKVVKVIRKYSKKIDLANAKPLQKSIMKTYRTLSAKDKNVEFTRMKDYAENPNI